MFFYGNHDEETAVDGLQQWFEENPKLPNKIDRNLLWRFYKRSSKDVEETKKLVETFYSLRLKNPRLFINRDPCDVDTENMYKYLHIVPLSRLTPENYHVTCVQFHKLDSKLIHFTEDIKTFIMIQDCHFMEPDVKLDKTAAILSDGEVVIMDMRGVTMKQVTTLIISTMSVFVKYINQAYPNRLRAVHMINCPSYLDKVLAFLKPFMNRELYDMMKCHTKGLESLYECIPKDMLPEEYGGNAGGMAELSLAYRDYVVKMRPLLMDPDYWTVQTSSEGQC
ncbi:alpha-tocopherol transfer protein-like [Musca domestica]|uniref:Alpha-tocopherol transfer protein-like n=1 Tax=Musca domestica TaxID=7370 RepID=A0A1I8N2H9_MUSDO|nr:alpha-tocopherol transfer protein-like [Musca domestica]